LSKELENNFPMADSNKDQSFATQIQRLHQLTVYGRWLMVVALWLIVAPLSMWNLRSEITILRQYFTWVSLRYSIYYHPFAAVGLSFCIGMTLAVLIWQSRNILFGIPEVEKQRLEEQVLKIRQQGESHPLWKWVMIPGKN
jgi:lipopolysaccharide export LptBFGC system permease protein LptF